VGRRSRPKNRISHLLFVFSLAERKNEQHRKIHRRSFVPYLGAIVALTPPVLLAYAQDGPVLALTIIVLAVIITSLT